MARHLVAAGYDVRVFDVSSAAAAAIAGATPTASAAEAAAGAECVFLSLPAPPDVEAAVVGADGVLAADPRPAFVVDLSTSSAEPVRRLHARCAEALQAIAPELAEREPEVLARHYTEAGFAGRAVELWLAAGRRAAERSANLEAIGHLRKGLAVLADLPEGEARARQELLLQLGRAAILGHAAACKQFDELLLFV